MKKKHISIITEKLKNGKSQAEIVADVFEEMLDALDNFIDFLDKEDKKDNEVRINLAAEFDDPSVFSGSGKHEK